MLTPLVLAASLSFAAPTPAPSFSATPNITPACPCGATTMLERQSRWKMKHRPPSQATPITVKVKDVLEWRNPDKIYLRQRRTSNSPIAAREEQVFSLTGYVQIIKFEDNDCDFHLEISQTPDSEGDRVIVEVPNDAENLVVWNEVVAFCKDRHKGKYLKPGKAFSFRSAPKIHVVGYAFYDARHWTKDQPKRGSNHGSRAVGTCWEIHPCFSFSGAQ